MKNIVKRWNFIFVLLVLGVMFVAAMITSVIGLLVSEDDKFQATLLSLPITISIFAVNFSFLGYQFSPYRSILKRISESHVLRSGILLAVSLFPLVCYFSLDNQITTKVLATIIPITVLGGIFLLYTSLQEIEPINILQKIASENAIKVFYREYGTKIFQLQKEIEEWKLSQVTDQPKHEWDSHFDPPSPEGDPMELVTNLVFVAVQNSDMQRFIAIMTKAIFTMEAGYAFDSKYLGEKGYRVTSRIHFHVSSGMKRIARICLDLDKSGLFCDRLNQILLFEIKKMASRSKQTTELALSLTSIACYLCESLLRERKTTIESTAFISAVRQVAQKGIDDPPESKDREKYEKIIFEHTLTSYPSYIKAMGISSITANNSGFLYKCMEALCWLGCSAVRNGNREITKECLRGISYLGRLSKHHKLTCFWSHCAMDPVDHAQENLWWMLTWLPKVQDEFTLKEMNNAFEEAYSRITGVIHTITFEVDSENKPIFQIQNSKKPHKVERFTTSVGGISHASVIDYSDFGMTKDHVL